MSNTNSNSFWYKFIVRFVFGVAMVVVMWFNLQPWLHVGRSFAEGMTFIPFESILRQIPVLGGIIGFARSFTADIITFILWLFVQSFQIAGMLANDLALMSAFKEAFGFMPLAGISKAHSAKLKSYAAIAYGLEAAVCFFVYPIYGSGPASLIANWRNLDPNQIDYFQMILLVITMLMFEVFISAACTLWITLIGTSSSRQQKEAA